MNNITVNYSGKEKSFDGIMSAVCFTGKLRKEGTGSDLWVNDELIQSQYKNHKTGNWVVESSVKTFEIVIA